MNQNEFLYPLSELINESRREDAYIWFREHQSHFSARERRLIRAVIAGRLWRAPVLLAVITLGLQAAAGSIFENQLQDMELDNFEENIVELSRSDWNATWPKTYDNLSSTAAMIASSLMRTW